MLDLGFLEDVEKILSLCPGGRQTALFSATMPPEIRALADRHLYDPVTVQVKAATLTIDTVEQFYVEVGAREKNDMLARVLESERPDQAIVFVRTKIRCDQLYRTLRDRGMNVKALHGDMSQGSRDGVMLAFKSGRLPILVATDVAARGLDISSVTHVVNFDVPTSPDVYVHRIGRTGRVGRSGRAIMFVEPRQKRELAAIEKNANTTIAPWSEGAKVDPAPAVERPRPAPQAARRRATNGDGAYTKLIASGGRAAGLAEADIIHAVAAGARPRRRGDPQRPPARALRAARGAREGRRARRRRGRRHRRARSHPETRTREELIPLSEITMTTNRGPIVFELFDDDAPKTVENFKKLAADGFYDGLVVPPHHQGLHDPGRLPAGHRHRRPRLHVRGRDQPRTRSSAARSRWPTPARTRTARSSSSSPSTPPRGSTASTPCSAR